MDDEIASIYRQLERCERFRDVLVDTDDRTALNAYKAKLEARLKTATARSTTSFPFPNLCRRPD